MDHEIVAGSCYVSIILNYIIIFSIVYHTITQISVSAVFHTHLYVTLRCARIRRAAVEIERSVVFLIFFSFVLRVKKAARKLHAFVFVLYVFDAKRWKKKKTHAKSLRNVLWRLVIDKFTRNSKKFTHIDSNTIRNDFNRAFFVMEKTFFYFVDKSVHSLFVDTYQKFNDRSAV